MKQFQKSLVLGVCALSLVVLAACNKTPKTAESEAGAASTANATATASATSTANY